MEATGIHRRPLWPVLAARVKARVKAGRTLILAAHVKNVSGGKTDVADAVWLSDLLAHGPIRPSFVPETGTRGDARSAPRPALQLVREEASHVRRIRNTPSMFGKTKRGRWPIRCPRILLLVLPYARGIASHDCSTM